MQMSSSRHPPELAPARFEELDDLNALVGASVRGLGKGFFTERQIESALRYVFGVDRTLIEDRTYFVARIDGVLAGCGGWSRRNRLFGGDQHASESQSFLDPAHDAARIRAFFIAPA